MRVRVDMLGTAVTELRDAEARLGNMLPAWTEAGEIMLKSVAKNFEAGGRPRWPATKGRAAPLEASGKLHASTEAFPDQQGVTIASRLPYSATQQYGRQSGRGAPIPARPFIVCQREDEKAIAEVLSNYVTGASRRSIRSSLLATYGVGE
jgi:phage gpG-like protein